MPTHRHPQRGFSLLEVLVAFAILAISLAVILGIFSRGMRSAALSDGYRHAMLLADNKMIELLHIQPLRAGTLSGQDKDYSWETEVRPANDRIASGIRHTIKRYELRVTVNWLEAGKQRSLVLNNLALQE